MAKTKRDVNFFQSVKKDIKQKDGKRHYGWVVALIFVLLLLAGIAFAAVKLYDAFLRQIEETERLREYIDDPMIQQRFSDVEAMRTQMASITAYNEAWQGYIEGIKASDRLTADAFKIIETCLVDGVTINAYRFEHDTVLIECKADDNSRPSEFADRLDASGHFAQVDYSGFTSQTLGESVVFAFTVECRLW